MVLPLLFVWACSGGGGGSTTSTQTAWEKFRHDISNTGAAPGAIATIRLTPRSVPVDAPTPPAFPTPSATPGAISSSPAIATDGTVYIGSEGGTLAAFDANLNLKWRKTFCEVCPADSQNLGPLISSPAIYTLHGQTSILIGSSASNGKSGSMYAFQDSGSGQPPSCTVCFRPDSADFSGSPDVTITASFVSSPSFTTDTVIGTLNGIVIGASVEVQQAASTHNVGKLYVLNSDGSEKWQFPRPGQSEIGPVTCSPALAINDTWWFTAADGFLYAIREGSQLGKVAIGSTFGPPVPFAPAVLMTGNYIVSPTGDGDIFAVTPDQFVSFRVASVDSGVGSSLAFGGRAEVTTTPTEVTMATATAPSGPTPTATATPTAGIASFVYGVTQSGQIVAFNPAQPTPTIFPPPQTPVAAPVISSPALSSDDFLVFGDGDGHLHAVSTADGSELTGFPLPLTANAIPIRSSPSIAENGTIYVGADDGMLYAVGLP
jgi:outer membrane protein assembly factor BamB